MSVNLGISNQIKEIDRVLSECAIKLDEIKNIKHHGVLYISTNFAVLNEMSEIIRDEFHAGRINKVNIEKIQSINELKKQSDDLKRLVCMASDDFLSDSSD
jgi:hypothetical protein